MTNCYKKNNLIFICAALVAMGCAKQHIASPDPNAGKVDATTMFVNPLKSTGPDPYVTRKDGYYYYMNTGANYLVLTRLEQMIYLKNAFSKTIFTPPISTPYSANVSKPEMHFLNGKWYAYFSADDGLTNNRRIYALENSSPDPLIGDWIMKGKVADLTNDSFASDGTVLSYNDQLYFLWSGIKGGSVGVDTIQQQLYIAKMSDPYTISGNRVMISEPTNPWEQYNYTVTLKNKAGKDSITLNKAEYIDQNPEIIKNAQGDVFVTFTASSCKSDDLSLGLLQLKKGSDPLIPSNWTKSATPVFITNTNGVYGPGFNGFFKSPDSTEDWIIYDANKLPGQGCGDTRSPRIQKFTWKTDGTPDFGAPVSLPDSLMRPAK